MIKTLLVDDENSLLEQAEIFLERDEEIEVETVSSAEKALELMDGEDFGLIVSDYKMPGMDGLEFLEELREERESDIPFIMFTGKGREEVAIKALNLGADRYIQKRGDTKSQYSVLIDAIKQESKQYTTQKELEEKSERLNFLKLATDTTEDLKITVIDEDYRYRVVNQWYAWEYDLQKNEIIGMSVSELMEEDTFKETIKPHLDKAFKGKKVEYTSWFDFPSGKKYMKVIYLPMEEAEVKSVAVIIQDITHGKEVEEEQRRSEKEKSLILENSPQLIVYQNKDHEVIWANERAAESVDKEPSDLEGGKCYEIWHERENPCEDCPVRESWRTGEPQMSEVKSPDGRYWEIRGNPVNDEQGNIIGAVEITSNITERKEYEQELKLKEKYLDHTPVFINVIDEEGKIKYHSYPSNEITGLDPSKFMGSEAIEFAHPDDREKTLEMFSKVLENPGEEYRTELRGEMEDGWIWLEVRAVNHLDDPDINGIIVSAQDISKRKEMEEELMKSERKFRNIFENLGDPVIIKKLGGEDDGSILGANKAMSDMLGYSSEELLEMNVYDDIAVDKPEKSSWDEVKEELKEGNRTEFTVKKKRKDGSEVWVEVVVVPMEYEGENAVLAVNRDVTDRERRKSELQERVKELDCLYTISNLTQKQDMTVESILQEVVESIPPGFSYPRDTSARITFDGQSYKSESFEESSQSLSKNFSTEYGSGEIEVYVDRKRDSEDVFLEEEKELLNSITVHLENFIERRESQQELERIEWMLSKEQVSSTSKKDSASDQDQGYGDLTDLNEDGMILQSLGKDLLKDIVSEYLDLLETSSAIYEKNGDYAFGIFSSGWCKLMDRQSRKLCDTEDNAAALKSGKWLCHESCWTDCSKEAIEKQEPVDIECNGGIRLYGVPIFAGGEVIGAIDFGYGTPPKCPEELQELAEKYNVDYEELVEEANRYNPRPDFIIELAKNRLNASARLIGMLVERKKAESALEENKNKIERLHGISAELQTYDSEKEVYSLAIETAEDHYSRRYRS